MAISTLCIMILAVVSCISAESNCRMVTFNGDKRVMYSCIQATLDDVHKIPEDAKWIHLAISKLPNLPERAFARFALNELSFINCKIGYIDPNAFDGLDKLRRLSFHGSSIRVLKASWFKSLSSLTQLFLGRNDMVYIEPKVFPLIPNLVRLNIEDNNINCLPSKALAPLIKLKHARIGKNPWLCSCYEELVGWMENQQINYGSDHATERLECMLEHSKPYRDFTVPPYKTFKNFSVSENGYIKMSLAKEVVYFGNDISALSEIPNDVQSIKFVNSEILKIPGFAFLRFGNSLKNLYFYNCSIREIHFNAFAGLAKLEMLVLLENNLGTVKSEWFQDLHSLENLALDKNNIDYIEPSVFPLLDKLKYWSITANRLECISTNELNSLTHLTKVILAHNPWNCSCQENFRKWLHENRIRYVVSRGQCIDGHIQESEDLFEQSFERRETNTKSQKHGLTYAKTIPERMRQNHAGRGKEIIKEDEEEEEEVDIDDFLNPSYKFEEEAKDITLENWSVKLRIDETPDLRNSYISVGGTIWDVLTISTNATAIRFKNSAIHTIFDGMFFSFGSNLRRLEFLNCIIRDIEPQAFQGLTNLQELILSDNQIQLVQSAWFEGISNLRKLTLARNSITHIDNGVFRLLTNLEELDISNNQLSCLEVDDLFYLKNLVAVDMSNNPWSCLCRTKLNEWLENNEEYVREFFDEIDDWDCSTEYTGFRITNDQETNYIDGDNSEAKKEVDELRKIQDIKIVESSKKIQKTESTKMDNSKIVRTGETNEDFNLALAKIWETTVPTPTTAKPEYSNGQCKLHQINRMTRNHWWCQGGDISVLDQIPSSAEGIDISRSNISIIPANAFVRFSNLIKLMFYTSSIRNIDPLAFASLNKLELLLFYNNSIPSVRSSWFHDLVNVTRLELVRNSITEIDSDVFEYLPNLRLLSIQENHLRCIYTKSLSSLKYLRRVSMQDNPWKWRCREEMTQFFEARNISYIKSETYEGKRVLDNFLTTENSNWIN